MLSVSVDVEGDSDTVSAYQLMGGVAFSISETTNMLAGYRYFGTGDMDTGGSKFSYGSHNFEVGILTRF